MLAKNLAARSNRALVFGPVSSRLRVTIFEDLLSPDCAQFHLSVEEGLLRKFRGWLTFEYRTLPDPNSELATRLAATSYYLAWILPELSFQFRRDVYQNQPQITNSNALETFLESFSRTRGLSYVRLARAISSSPIQKMIERDRTEATRLGITEVPGIVTPVGIFQHPVDAEEIEQALREASKMAK